MRAKEAARNQLPLASHKFPDSSDEYSQSNEQESGHVNSPVIWDAFPQRLVNSAPIQPNVVTSPFHEEHPRIVKLAIKLAVDPDRARREHVGSIGINAKLFRRAE